MNETTTMLMIGIGGAGCAIARGVNRAFGGGIRMLLADTDATSASEGEPFVLLGGDRLSGHGAGGDIVSARTATKDSVNAIDSYLEGIRLVVVTTSLGGGTGGGATIEILQHISRLGIPTIVFATTPFTFEGEERQRAARGVTGLIEEYSNALCLIPLDKLVGGEDNMEDAMSRAIGTMASGATLFWRLTQKPGYIKMDAERIRHVLSKSGYGRFAAVTTQGPNRAEEAANALSGSPLLTAGTNRPATILCGILAGDDLRLSEIGRVTDTLRSSFGPTCAFELGTVNDEETFSGRLSVVVMIFEESNKEQSPAKGGEKRRKSPRSTSKTPTPSGRFQDMQPTIWHGEDLDTPTYLRRGFALEP